jgi:hypothetical protein
VKRSGNLRTLRGTMNLRGTEGVPPGQTPTIDKRRLVLNDGRLNVGYLVTQFICWPETFDANFAMVAQLSTDPGFAFGGQPVSNARDNRQIAWFQGGFFAMNPGAIVDPDHIVNRDLFINTHQTSTNMELNYMVTLEEVNLTDDDAIVVILKEEAQNIGPS